MKRAPLDFKHQKTKYSLKEREKRRETTGELQQNPLTPQFFANQKLKEHSNIKLTMSLKICKRNKKLQQ